MYRTVEDRYQVLLQLERETLEAMMARRWIVARACFDRMTDYVEGDRAATFAHLAEWAVQLAEGDSIQAFCTLRYECWEDPEELELGKEAYGATAAELLLDGEAGSEETHGRQDRGEEFMTGVLSSVSHVRYLGLAAWAFELAGRFEESEALLEQLQIEPNELESACGRLAVAHYSELVAKSRRRATTFAGFAGALVDADRCDEALEKAERAIRLDAGCLRAHLALSRAAVRGSDPYQAVVALEQIVAVQPGMSYSHEDTAGPLEAAATLERATQVLSSSSYLRQKVADLYLAYLSDRDRAIEELWAAVELAPYPWGPWEKLEALLVEDERWSEIDRLLRLLSNQYQASSSWAMVLEQESERIEQLASGSSSTRKMSRFMGCCLPLLAPLFVLIGLGAAWSCW